MAVDVVAVITPAPGKESRLEELLNELASKVEKHEDGVARYQPYKSVGDGSSVEFVVVERYNDEASYEAHTKTDHFGALVKSLGEEGLVAKAPSIMKLQALSAGFDAR